MTDNQNYPRIETGYSEDSLKYLSYEERVTFFCIFLILCTISVCGNTATIVVTTQRKQRFIQKTCVISLALSDLLVTIACAINNLETFSHPLINWTLGKFMCSFLPTCQILGVMTSSMALTAIALDRYRNIVKAINKRWNPQPLYCLIAATLVWISCGGASYPLWILFEYKQATVVDMNASPITRQTLSFCVSVQKEALMTFHVTTTVIIFVPLIVTFFWLYYKVAKLIWKHRKPISAIFNNKKDENSTPETSTTQVKSTETSNTLTSTGIYQRKLDKTAKNINAKRKIQTFKIIIVLIVVYILCRLPYHVFTILKVVGTYNEPRHWTMTYVFTGLVLLNCALNPFLYTFLKPTVRVFVRIHKIFISDFLCKICCCCCTNAEFEEFERENPFTVDTFERKSVESRVGSQHSDRTGKRNSKVKFSEALGEKRRSRDDLQKDRKF